MIILIGGESHTGKTLLAQRLMEIYKIPYTSIDHIKMGIYRGCPDFGFTPYDHVDMISKKLWPVIKGIIDTCAENKQNIILEGCYLPQEEINDIMNKDILPLYLYFSESYIKNNFHDIVNYENVIEKRKFSGDINVISFIKSNNDNRIKCEKFNLPYFEITENYKEEIKQVYSYIGERLN